MFEIVFRVAVNFAKVLGLGRIGSNNKQRMRLG